MPTLVGDQIPVAAEARQLLQGWTSSLWGEPIRLINPDDLEATILWDPPLRWHLLLSPPQLQGTYL